MATDWNRLDIALRLEIILHGVFNLCVLAGITLTLYQQRERTRFCDNYRNGKYSAADGLSRRTIRQFILCEALFQLFRLPRAMGPYTDRALVGMELLAQQNSTAMIYACMVVLVYHILQQASVAIYMRGLNARWKKAYNACIIFVIVAENSLAVVELGLDERWPRAVHYILLCTINVVVPAVAWWQIYRILTILDNAVLTDESYKKDRSVSRNGKPRQDPYSGTVPITTRTLPAPSETLPQMNALNNALAARAEESKNHAAGVGRDGSDRTVITIPDDEDLEEAGSEEDGDQCGDLFVSPGSGTMRAPPGMELSTNGLFGQDTSFNTSMMLPSIVGYRSDIANMPDLDIVQPPPLPEADEEYDEEEDYEEEEEEEEAQQANGAHDEHMTDRDRTRAVTTGSINERQTKAVPANVMTVAVVPVGGEAAVPYGERQRAATDAPIGTKKKKRKRKGMHKRQTTMTMIPDIVRTASRRAIKRVKELSPGARQMKQLLQLASACSVLALASTTVNIIRAHRILQHPSRPFFPSSDDPESYAYHGINSTLAFQDFLMASLLWWAWTGTVVNLTQCKCAEAKLPFRGVAHRDVARWSAE